MLLSRLCCGQSRHPILASSFGGRHKFQGIYERHKILALVAFLLGLAPTILGVVPAFAHPAAPAAPSSPAWTSTANGIEYLELPFMLANKQFGNVLVVRANPSSLFRVLYRQGVVANVWQWAQGAANAAVIVNANFFRGRGQSQGLVVSEGKLLNPFLNRPDAGLFTVSNGVPRVYPASSMRFNPAKLPDEAIQGAPVLMSNGVPTQTFGNVETLRRERRTVIAQDNEGTILILIFSPMEITFYETALWLGQSGLNINTAVNLDGGLSTQLYLANGPSVIDAATAQVPVVLAIFEQ